MSNSSYDTAVNAYLIEFPGTAYQHKEWTREGKVLEKLQVRHEITQTIEAQRIMSLTSSTVSAVYRLLRIRVSVEDYWPPTPAPAQLIPAIRRATDLTVFPNLKLTQSRALPDCPAIYIVFFPPNDIQYVGRAKSLVTRWRTHHFLWARMRIAWFEVGVDQQDVIERKLIALFRPPLNIQFNPAVKGRRRRRYV